MLKLLHLADLHLGHPLSLLPRAAAAGWREARMAALEAVLTRAADEGVHAFLFAGDIFDSPFPDPEIAKRFFGMLERLGVPAFLAPGNHDPYVPASVWESTPLPPSVYLFRTPELAYFDLPELGLTVYGYAFGAEHTVAPPLGIASDRLKGRCSVLLAHGDLAAPLSPYAPLPAEALAASGFTYAALGHVHNPPPPRRLGKTLVAYSGFFAGCGFDECGEGQALLLTVDAPAEQEPATGKGAGTLPLTLTQIPIPAPVFSTETLDCTGDEDGEDLRCRVAQYLEARPRREREALRLTLAGEVGLSCTPSPEALRRLGAHFTHFVCRDETLPVLGAEYLEADPSLRGAFYRALLPQLHDADEGARRTAAQALRIGLAALAGREVEL